MKPREVRPRRKPGQSVYPHDPLARADVNRWMFWACQHFAPAIGW